MRMVFIGNGQMLLSCLEEAARQDVSHITTVVTVEGGRVAEAVREFCQGAGIRFMQVADLNADDLLRALEEDAADYIVNVNSRVLFRAEYFGLARHGIVNFHNSLLPHYRGINVCSWAIINREFEYGATWHLLSQVAVDGGSILEQERFALLSDETAFSLILKCVDVGVRLFPALYCRLCVGDTAGVPMADVQANRLYLRRERPAGNGHLDFGQPFTAIEALVRGLDFGFLPNDFVDAHVLVGGQRFVVRRVRKQEGSVGQEEGEVGRVVAVGDSALSVRCWDGVVDLVRLEFQGKRLTPGMLVELTGVRVGDALGEGACMPG